jgi:hypothetical protein
VNRFDASDDLALDDLGAKVETPDERTVNYVFPVTVVVVGALSDDDHEAIDRRFWGTFNDAMRSSA